MSSLLGVLQAVYRQHISTRRGLSEYTGLSAGRISTLVAQLLQQHMLMEELNQEGVPGRPAGALCVNPAAGRVVGLDIGGRTTRAILADLSGQILVSLIHPTRAVPDRQVILEDITNTINAVCEQGGAQPDTLLALGIGVQGIVDTRDGITLGWPNTPSWASAWSGWNLPAALRALLSHDLVLVDDSVRAMGATAYRFGRAQGNSNFLYVFLGNGIGSSLFIDGHPYRGGIGLSGELGHISIDEDGPLCSCGNQGCLEMLASTDAVLRRVGQRLAKPHLFSTLRNLYESQTLTLDAVIEAAHAGDKLAFWILDETGQFVGRSLAIALNLLGPKSVVLGGPLAQDDSILLRAVQRQVHLRALGHVSRQVQIACDSQGELAGAQGAALLALDALFDSVEHLERLLVAHVAQ